MVVSRRWARIQYSGSLMTKMEKLVKGRKCVETVTRAQSACDMASGRQSCVFGQGKVFFMEHYLEEALRTLVVA